MGHDERARQKNATRKRNKKRERERRLRNEKRSGSDERSNLGLEITDLLLVSPNDR